MWNLARNAKYPKFMNLDSILKNLNVRKFRKDSYKVKDPVLNDLRYCPNRGSFIRIHISGSLQHTHFSVTGTYSAFETFTLSFKNSKTLSKKFLRIIIVTLSRVQKYFLYFSQKKK